MFRLTMVAIASMIAFTSCTTRFSDVMFTDGTVKSIDLDRMQDYVSKGDSIVVRKTSSSRYGIWYYAQGFKVSNTLKPDFDSEGTYTTKEDSIRTVYYHHSYRFAIIL